MYVQPLVIAGSGRSGTTWVLDVLAETHNLRPVFEPLNPSGVHDARNFANHYLRANDNDPALERFMRDVFQGKLNCRWTTVRVSHNLWQCSFSNLFSKQYYGYLKRRYQRIITRHIDYFPKRNCKPIIKFIRANLMLEWLFQNFNIKLIFIVRHPGAVVASQMCAAKSRGGTGWDFNSSAAQEIMSLLTNDSRLNEDFLQKYDSIFSERLTPAGGLTLLWCIENILPIYNLQQKKYPVFFYENIVMQPDKEFRRMNRILGFEKIPGKALIDRPSQQSSLQFQNQATKHKKLSRWMNVLTREELRQIDKIMIFFNVTLYNAYESLPVSRIQETI